MINLPDEYRQPIPNYLDDDWEIVVPQSIVYETYNTVGFPLWTMTLADLFGGRTRAEALRLLATSSRPVSGYRIAKMIGAEPIQVTTVLRNLTGFVERTDDGWSLVDPTLRQLLRNQLRLRPSSWKPNKAFLEATRSLRREPEKDQVLRKYKLRTADEARGL